MPSRSLAVVIPWRPSPGRERHLAIVRAAIEMALPGAPMILADSGDATFHRAASRNEGVAQADAEVVVVCDADTIPEPGPLQEAIDAAGDGRLHLPYTVCRLLTRLATRRVLDGGSERFAAGEADYSNSLGGVLVVATETWREVGGQDERFTGWGFEDVAFAVAVGTLVGPLVRHEGMIRHLWHPDGRGIGSPQWRAGKTLCDRYTDAQGDRAAIRALIEEHTHAAV